VGVRGTHPPTLLQSSGMNHRAGPPSLQRAISCAASMYSLIPPLLAAVASSARGRGALETRHRAIDLGRPSSAAPAWGRSGSGLGTMVDAGMVDGWLAGP
jgi:hypothetical protein